MNLGKVITQRCVGEPCGPDPRCADPVFALMNPDICPPLPYLLIRPSFALTCQLGSIQFAASFFNEQGVETDVTDDTLFASSDLEVVLIGAVSGNATGLSTGEVTITGTYVRDGETFTGTAELTVLGDDCCDDQNVAMMVLVDRTKSMSQPFAGYPSKLGFAKAAASRFISEVNEQKDLVGLISFTALGPSVLASPTSDKASVTALVPGINQTQQLTTFYDALSEAITELNAITTAELRVIVLISDGEDKDDSYSTADNPIALLQDFKDAGGIVITMGVRAHDFGYRLLSHFSTGGFSLNAFGANAEASLDFLSGLKGYICAGNCTDPGDEFRASAHLNYCGFANWNVFDGHVDLMGNGFLDLLPGNGLFVDLAGSRSGFHGRLESKATFQIEQDKRYLIRLSLAGNQRVNATPNTVHVSVFARDVDTIATPVNAPVADAPSGTGVATFQEYEYAYSYVNENGETPLSPVETGDNGGLSSFSLTVTATAEASATLVRFYKRVSGTDTWYKVAESDADDPQFTDTFDADDIADGLADGTFDACAQPVTLNRTGTPIVLFEQDITIDDYAQPFATINLQFDAPDDTADAWLAIQQTDSPSGYDSIGLLLDYVLFENVTDDTDLLEDDFDGENVVYVPPACGMGTYYVPVGYYFMPGDFTPLVPTMESNTSPSGEVSTAASAMLAGNAWYAFFDEETLGPQVWIGTGNVNPDNSVPDTEWVKYDFTANGGPGPQIVTRYSFNTHHSVVEQQMPTGWILEGSNDDVIWTQIDEQTGITNWVYGVDKFFTVSNPGSYRYYRLTFTTYDQVQDEPSDTQFNICNLQFYGGTEGSYGLSFGYAYGYDCYGVGCLDEPPDVQAQDPSPLTDIEVGTPPEPHEADVDIVRACLAGSVYVPDEWLTTSLEVDHCEDIITAKLTGLRWEMPLLSFSDQFGGPAAPDPADQVVHMHAPTGTVYDVVLRFRGVVERQNKGGVDVGSVANFCTLVNQIFPPLPLPNGTNGNCYYLKITTPNEADRIYFLCAFGAGTPARCYVIDYTIEVEIAWNSVVTLISRSQDGLMNANLVYLTQNGYVPGVVPGIRNGGTEIAGPTCTIPATGCTPFFGQFIQMDVVSVTLQP